MKEKLTKLIIALVAIIAIGGSAYAAKDNIIVFVENIFSETSAEEGYNDEEVVESTTPILTINGFYGDKATWYYDPLNPDELKKVGQLLDKSPSKYIWGKLSYYWGGNCEFYNVKKETFIANLHRVEGKLVEGSNLGEFEKIDIITDNITDYVASVFNRTYRKRGMDSVEFANQWADEDWDGEEFLEDYYQKYKLITKTSKPVLKHVICGEYNDGVQEGIPFSTYICIYEVEITTKEGEPHPMEWLPQVGETKKVNIAVSGGYNNMNYTEACIVNVGVL